MSEEREKSLELFATCPPSSTAERDSYLASVVEVARWSEKYGCTGILIYADNSMIDAWLIAQSIIQNTKRLCPLIAVQPVYMHPYSVAKLVTSFGFLYGRQVYLNMVAGGFKNDLLALDDRTPHDHRYARVVEYTSIIKQLLAASAPVTYEGEFYRIYNLRITPSLPPELLPRIFISGSSEAGLNAACLLGATAVKYPKSAKDCETETLPSGIDTGIRVGIIARERQEDAWQSAEERFPENRKGQITHQLAMKVSDSLWHSDLSRLAKENGNDRTLYWLRPFENYKTFCPYLVGSYEQVSEELASYMSLGYHTYILDVPPNAEELEHTRAVFSLAHEKQTIRT
jgi:alkanesulfonate monooxygenase